MNRLMKHLINSHFDLIHSQKSIVSKYKTLSIDLILVE
jgi:hypothetical protein